MSEPDEGFEVGFYRVRLDGDAVRLEPSEKARLATAIMPTSALTPQAAISLGLALIGRGEEAYRAAALEAAHHLRNLPASKESDDIRIAEALERAAGAPR